MFRATNLDQCQFLDFWILSIALWFKSHSRFQKLYLFHGKSWKWEIYVLIFIAVKISSNLFSRKKVIALDLLAPNNNVLIFKENIWKRCILWVFGRNSYFGGLFEPRKKKDSQKSQKSKKFSLVAKCGKTCFHVFLKETKSYFSF